MGKFGILLSKERPVFSQGADGSWVCGSAPELIAWKFLLRYPLRNLGLSLRSAVRDAVDLYRIICIRDESV